MKLKLLFVSFFLFTVHIHAQQNWARANDYPDIKNRPLIVEMLELDEKLIEKWEKKKSRAKNEKNTSKYQDKIDTYTVFVTDYNNLIKKAVESHWNINPKLIYKTTSEVNALMKKKSEEFTVLWFSETDSNRRDDYGATYFPHLTVPTLNYSRIEKGRIKRDYCYFMHLTHNRRDRVIYSDFVFSLKLMKHHIDYIIENDKKKFSFQEYVIEESTQNCRDFSGKTAFIQEEGIYKKTNTIEMSKVFSGEIKSYSDEEISKAIVEGEDRIIGFFFPFSIVIGKIGPTTKAQISYVRSFINTKTGKIYTSMGGKMGQFFDPYFREKEFEKYDDCK